MTISSENNVNRYTADGVQTAFTGTFKIYDQTHVKVLVDDIVQTLGTDYTVSGVGNESGFTVTFTTAPAGGKTVTLLLNPPHTQLTDYTSLDPFPAETHERALDLLTQQVLKLKEKLGRLLGFKEKSTYKDITVDDPVAGRFLRWKADLSGLENIDISQVGALAVSDYIRTLLDDPDSSAAAGTLDLSNTTDVTKGDALVGFRQPRSGAVARTVHDKLGELVSVADFGAKGDGLTDDTAAIQAALDSGAGRVYVPPGTYIVSSTLLVPSNTVIFGAGSGSSIIKKKVGAAIGCISNKNAGTGTRDNNIVIADLQVVGEGTATTLFGVRLDNCDRASVVRVYTKDILNGDSAAIDIDSSTEFIVSGCVVENTTNNGIKVRCSTRASRYFVISGNRVIATAAQNGIFVANNNTYAASDFVIEANTVNSTADVGIEIGNTGSVQHSAFVIGGNTISSSTNDGILVRNAKDGAVTGNTITGGASLSTSGGITLYAAEANVEGVTVVGNTVSGLIAGSGVRLAYAGTYRIRRVVVSDNNITLGAGAYSGIIATGGLEDSSIRGNVINNAGRHGLELAGSSAAALPVARCTIIGNAVRGSTYDGIFAAYASECVINGNVLTGNGRYGISLADSPNKNYISGNVFSGNVSGDIDGVVQQITSAADQIELRSNLIKLTQTAAYTLTSAPTIPDGYDGQVIRVVNIGSFDVTLQDKSTLAGSNLWLSAASVTIQPGDSIILMFVPEAAGGVWVQIGQTNVL